MAVKPKMDSSELLSQRKSKGPAEGYLEVGLNEEFQVVINHPNLDPDENGVGHIVFSIEEARALSTLLDRKAAEAENRKNLEKGTVICGWPRSGDGTR